MKKEDLKLHLYRLTFDETDYDELEEVAYLGYRWQDIYDLKLVGIAGREHPEYGMYFKDYKGISGFKIVDFGIMTPPEYANIGPMIITESWVES